jgi:hypothetical protein
LQYKWDREGPGRNPRIGWSSRNVTATVLVTSK